MAEPKKDAKAVKALIAKHKVEAAKAAVAQSRRAAHEDGVAARLARWVTGRS